MIEAGRHSNDPKDSTASWITKLNHEPQSFTAANMEKNTAGRDQSISEAEVDDWYLKCEMSILAGDHRLHQRMPRAERSKPVGYADQYFKLLGPELETDEKRQQEFLRLTHRWAQAAASGGHEHEWLERLALSMQIRHPDQMERSVRPEALNTFLLPSTPTHVREQVVLVQQAKGGEHIPLYRPPKRQRTPLNPSAKMHINEVWAQI